MKSMSPLAFALVFLPLLAAADEDFRCGKWVVSSSASTEELIEKCGAPTSKESTTEDVMVANQNGFVRKIGETIKERWTYHRGTQAKPMVVTIIDGRIKSIDRQE